MFAIISLGGKQYAVKEKDVLRVEKMAEEPGKTATLDKVLLVADAKSIKIGTPFVPNASVELNILKTAKGEKVRIFKMKAKKRYKKLKGHRQIFTEVEVTKIKA